MSAPPLPEGRFAGAISIRRLVPETDLATVAAFYDDAADYWILADRTQPDLAKAAAFFTDGPPGADPAKAHHLGLFADDRLVGVAELSFGFPDAVDAYLGLMLLAPGVRGHGLGQLFLRHIEAIAQTRGAPRILLGVLDENPRGRAFWLREGFVATGVVRDDAGTGHRLRRMAKAL